MIGRIRPLQEEVGGDPYRVVLLSLLLQRTRWRQAKVKYEQFLAKYPEHADALGASDEELVDLLKEIGLPRHRVKQMRKIFAYVQVHGWPNNVESLAHLPAGRYVKESYRIFVLGDHQLDPEDKVLSEYLHQEARRDAA